MNHNLRISVAVPVSEVLARLSAHVVSEVSTDEAAPWPHYQGEIRETDFKLIAPPRFGFTRFGLRKGPRYTRLPITIAGSLTANGNETLVEARVSLTSDSRWLVLGLPLGMLLILSVLLYPMYSLNRAFVIEIVGVSSLFTVVLSSLMTWLSLNLDKNDFQNVLRGHARW